MFRKRDLVGVVRVGLVAVDGLSTVWVFCRLGDLGICWLGRWLHGRLEPRRSIGGPVVVEGRRRVLEAVELRRRGVHLRWLMRGRGLRTATIATGHGVSVHAGVFLQGERVNVGACDSTWGRSKVEDPQNLK